MIFICFLSFIPWPVPPGSVTIQCSRENSRVVRKIVQSKLTPIFQKYHVELPLECPFHPSRDLFAPQENAKVKHRPTQWTCGFCGKSFYEEKFLDLHFDNRHRGRVNEAEDAICLADYCDIMRCDVLVAKDSSLGSFSQSSGSTDIELYNEATALAAARREVIKSQMKSKSFNLPPSLRDRLNEILAATGHKIEPPAPKVKIHKRKRKLCNENMKKSEPTLNQNDSTKSDDDGAGDDDKDGSAQCETLADRKQQRFTEMQRLKANCKSDETHKLKNRCERLIRTCIAGALVKLSIEDFKSMEGELSEWEKVYQLPNNRVHLSDEMNKAVCWYLTCDRYWEDASAQRPFPWALGEIFFFPNTFWLFAEVFEFISSLHIRGCTVAGDLFVLLHHLGSVRVSLRFLAHFSCFSFSMFTAS